MERIPKESGKKPDLAKAKAEYDALIAERAAKFPEVSEPLAAYGFAKQDFDRDLGYVKEDPTLAMKKAVDAGKDWTTNLVPGMQTFKHLMSVVDGLITHRPRGYKPSSLADIRDAIKDWSEARARWQKVKSGREALASEAKLAEAKTALDEALVALPEPRLVEYVKTQLAIAELKQKIAE